MVVLAPQALPYPAAKTVFSSALNSHHQAKWLTGSLSDAHSVIVINLRPAGGCRVGISLGLPSSHGLD